MNKSVRNNSRGHVEGVSFVDKQVKRCLNSSFQKKPGGTGIDGVTHWIIKIEKI